MNPTSITELVFLDLDRELSVTRRVLERLPETKFGWKPHEKSMSLGQLAMHVANLPQWMFDTLSKDELDMANPPQMRNNATKLSEVLETFDRNARQVRDVISCMNEAALRQTWTLRNGQQVMHTASRATITRLWCLNHMIHHRAQLCMLLRLLNEPVPAVYFNSVDEPEWIFV